MEPYSAPLLTLAIPVCSLMAMRSVRRKSLTIPAAIVGWATGILMVGAGLRGLTLFFFYLVGSSATKYKARVKKQLVGDMGDAQRGVIQVVCTSSLACLVTVYAAFTYGAETPLNSASPSLSCAAAIVAHHATALADTLASELGVVWAKNPPVSILNVFQQVPIGTNGGITSAGCAISLVGGTLVGCFTSLMDFLSGNANMRSCVAVVVFSSLTGLLGSLLDSMIGAIFQATYISSRDGQVVKKDQTGARLLQGQDILSNEQVNLVSTAITMILGGWVLAPHIF